MPKGIGPFICILIIVLDIIAGILGIEAEIAQDKGKHLRVLIFECRDPSRQTFNLGLSAALLLGLAHVIANLLGGFVCICSKDELDRATANKQLAAACLILSWIILAVAFSMLIIGTMANSKSRGSCGMSSSREKPKKQYRIRKECQKNMGGGANMSAEASGFLALFSEMD